jgi:hypothetical protein
MVKAPRKKVSPLPAGNYGTSTMHSTHRRHQANEGQTGMEADRVRELGALRSLRSKKKLSVEKSQGTHFARNEEKEKSIEDYAERESGVARKQVQDAETAIMQEVKDMTTAASAATTTRKPETTFDDMLNPIGGRLSEHACSDHEQDREDKEDDEEDTELGKMSDNGVPAWERGTIHKTVQHRMESSRQEQMRLDEVTQPEWGDAANYFRESDMKYGTAELKVLAVLQHQIDTTAATPSLTTFGQHMQTVEIVSGQSHMPAVTSRPGCSQPRLGLDKPESHTFTLVFSPNAEPDLIPIPDTKPAAALSFYHCIRHPL